MGIPHDTWGRPSPWTGGRKLFTVAGLKLDGRHPVERGVHVRKLDGGGGPGGRGLA